MRARAETAWAASKYSDFPRFRVFACLSATLAFLSSSTGLSDESVRRNSPVVADELGFRLLPRRVSETARLPLVPQGESTEDYRFYTAEPACGTCRLLNEIPSVNSFITTNSPSTYEFFTVVGIRHIPTSLFPEKVDDILTFLSVRYRLDPGNTPAMIRFIRPITVRP